MPIKTESKTDRIKNELEQLKFMLNSSHQYLEKYFNQLRNDSKNVEITNKINSYLIECLKNELNSEFKNEIIKSIEIIEFKIANYKEKECIDEDSDSDYDEDDSDEDDSDDDDDDDSDDEDSDYDDFFEEDSDFKEIKNLIQIEKLKIKKILLSNKTYVCLNRSNCKDSFLLNGYESKLIICLDECFYEQSILSLKKNKIFSNGHLTNTKIKLKLLREQIQNSTQIIECELNVSEQNELSLYNNLLTSIASNSFEGFKNLKILNLSWNKLTTLPLDLFNNLSGLLLLSLSGNPLTIIDPDTFKNLNKLEILRMSYNQLTQLDSKLFNNLVNLKELWLSYNQLSQIDPSTFTGLSKLNELRLTSNQLSNIEHKTFNGLNNLKILDLRFNQLDELDPNTFDGLNNLQDCYFVRKSI